MSKVKLFYNGQPIGIADEDDVELAMLHISEEKNPVESTREFMAEGYILRQVIAIRREARTRLIRRRRIEE